MLHLHVLPEQLCPRWDLQVESSSLRVISQILSPLALLRIQGRAAADGARVGGLLRRRSLHGMDKILIFGENVGCRCNIWYKGCVLFLFKLVADVRLKFKVKSKLSAQLKALKHFIHSQSLSLWESTAALSLPDVATMKWSSSAKTL